MSLYRFKFVDSPWFPLVVGLGLSALLTWLFFEPSYSWGYFPYTQEELRYASLLRHFQAAQSDGILYPRWLPDLYGGYGYPTFIFYQPFFFFVAACVAAVLGVGPPLACQLACAILFFGGTLGAYLLGYRLSRKNVLGGFWCCMTFGLAPYLVIDYSIRGSLSEFSAMMMTPWPLFSGLLLLERVKEKRAKLMPTLLLVGSLAGLICAHPATALLFLPAFSILIGVCILTHFHGAQRKDAIQYIFFQTALALSLSSFYWWPVFQMKKWVNLKAVTLGYYDPLNHLIQLKQLFGTTWSWSSGLYEMSFQLSLTHFIIALVALCVVWQRTWFRTVGILYFVTLLMIYRNPLSEWVWAQDTLLKNVQFPWRALSLVVILQAVLSVGMALSPMKRGSQWALAICVGIWFLTSQQEMRQVSPESQRRAVDTYEAVTERVASEYQAALTHNARFANMDEFLPVYAASGMPPRDKTPLIQTRDGSIVQLEDHSRHHVRVMIHHDKSGIVRIHQLYFEGFIILLDGQQLDTLRVREGVSQEGFMQVVVPQGRHSLEVYYEGPPGHMSRVLMNLFLLGAYLLFVFRRRRIKKEAR